VPLVWAKPCSSGGSSPIACVPEYGSDRTPVARVDLDFVDLAFLAENPWLLQVGGLHHEYSLVKEAA
jgi:hypothetical protein